MTERGRGVMAFAGRVVGVEWSGEHARRAASLALGPGTDGDEHLPDVIFRLGVRDDTRMVTVFRGRDCLYRGDMIGTGAHVLVQSVLDSLIDRSDGGLVLHAALLGRGNDGILLPGSSGSGKSVLAAWLALRGLVPLSDEACYLPDGESLLQPYARPFCFKGAWSDLIGFQGGWPGGVLKDAAVSLVPREVLNDAKAPAEITPRLIVFPHFASDAECALTRLTPARAVVRLLGTVANARNLRDHGVGRLTSLARSIEAWDLTYRSFDQLDPLVEMIESLPRH